MLQAARTAHSMIKRETRKSLGQDIKLQLALAKAFEIIGEAASKVSSETQWSYSQMQWQTLIGLRNTLIHSYLDIDLDKLWEAANFDLPPLIAQLEEILTANPTQ